MYVIYLLHTTKRTFTVNIFHTHHAFHFSMLANRQRLTTATLIITNARHYHYFPSIYHPFPSHCNLSPPCYPTLTRLILPPYHDLQLYLGPYTLPLLAFLSPL
jgi:hypothetical protein